MDKDMYNNQSVPVATCPRMDAGDIRFLQNCVEHFDVAASKYVALLLSKLQVHNARITEAQDRFLNNPLYDVRQIGLARNIETFIADAVQTKAFARQLYRFARFEIDAAPAAPNAHAAMAAFNECHLDPMRDVAAWNALTNRYRETAAKGAYTGPAQG